MTLTNNTRRIEELSGAVTVLVDNKKYEEAHCALDDIEAKVHALRRHIDNLQNVSDFYCKPPGPGTRGDEIAEYLKETNQKP